MCVDSCIAEGFSLNKCVTASNDRGLSTIVLQVAAIDDRCPIIAYPGQNGLVSVALSLKFVGCEPFLR